MTWVLCWVTLCDAAEKQKYEAYESTARATHSITFLGTFCAQLKNRRFVWREGQGLMTCEEQVSL